ncbi:hypothetical protein VYU27_008996 [Nannochloropsis oceanica]
MTGCRCILFLFLAIASTASAQRQHLQQGSSLGSMPTFQIQSHAVTPATGPTPMQFIPVASPAVPTPKAAGGNTSPESLYKQQRVEYTFPVPVTLAPVQRDGNGWTKAFAAIPCLQCYVTDAGCYYEYTQQAKTQIAFLSGEQFKRLLTSCVSTPGKVTQSCWQAAGLENVKLEDYQYEVYAYHDKGAEAVFEGTYLVFNNGNDRADINYGMAYFGLKSGAPSEPGGLVVAKGEGKIPTRLKEVVQGLKHPITIPKATNTIAAAIPPTQQQQQQQRRPKALRIPPPVELRNKAEEGKEGEWTRHALGLGNEVAADGYNWWSNAGAEYDGGSLVASFLSGEFYTKLRLLCPETTAEGLWILTSECWKEIANESTKPQVLESGGRIERAYVDGAGGNEGGSCVDGWWILMNVSQEADAKVTQADANFGLRTLDKNPRDEH